MAGDDKWRSLALASEQFATRTNNKNKNGGYINIATLEERNRSELFWGSRKKGGSKITDEITNY